MDDASDKPYQSPYAQATPPEEPCSRDSDYARAPPTAGSENAFLTMEETPKVHAPHSGDPCVEQEHETVEKPRSRESLKGFKKLLKFGRKSHGGAATPSEPAFELLDSSPADDQAPADTSSGEGTTPPTSLASADPTPSAN